MNKDLRTKCPFCAGKITVDHILWDCKETEIKRLQMNITTENWKVSKEEMEKLLQYVKEIELYNGM
jgi:undecaprenyl pyrophosphate synthase